MAVEGIELEEWGDGEEGISPDLMGRAQERIGVGNAGEDGVHCWDPLGFY